jgi:hypothetical protein
MDHCRLLLAFYRRMNRWKYCCHQRPASFRQTERRRQLSAS